MPSGRPDLLLSDFLFHVAGAFRGPVELSVVFSGSPFERCSELEGECNYSWRRISFCVVEHRLCPFAQKAESMILITLRMLTCWTLGRVARSSQLTTRRCVLWPNATRPFFATSARIKNDVWSKKWTLKIGTGCRNNLQTPLPHPLCLFWFLISGRK